MGMPSIRDSSQRRAASFIWRPQFTKQETNINSSYEGTRVRSAINAIWNDGQGRLYVAGDNGAILTKTLR